MTRVHQAASLLILAFSAWVAVSAYKMTYWAYIGPGPGFFPFWLAMLMGTLAVIWFIQLWLSPLPGDASDMVPSRIGCVRIASLLFSSILFGYCVERIGFSLSMLGLLLFLLTALGRQKWYVTLSISLIGSFGVHYLFSHHLKVPLPASAIGFLNSMGL
jgi:putative tricarboxylic transport membrane protein